jgi:nitrogen-specific signal transduction histidine kinase
MFRSSFKPASGPRPVATKRLHSCRSKGDDAIEPLAADGREVGGITLVAAQPKPRVEIGVEPRGAETVFFVRDNGMGIDPGYHDKVFSLFEKLDPKGEGTGMGLALVKRIVELYQGRIWVESSGPGRGASFSCSICPRR